jgi:prepilin-type processing-associated H-X9-DG protein
MGNSQNTATSARMMNSHPRHFFTLVEMLTVVMILAVLVSLVMPSLQRSRDRAHGVTCMSNMRQLAQAYTFYTKNSDFNLPGADTGRSSWDWVKSGDLPPAITGGTLWPFIEDLAVYRCPKDFRWDKFKKVRSDYFWRAYSINGYLNGERKNHAGGVTKWTKVQNSFDNVFAIVEEQDPRGYNMNSFFLATPPGTLRTWSNADWMAPLHLQGYNLTFLDGHVEYIKTLDQLSMVAALYSGVNVPNSNVDRQKLWSHHLAK